jgi:hypothetical protein
VEVGPPGKPAVLAAIAHVLAVVDATRVVDPVAVQAADDVVDVLEGRLHERFPATFPSGEGTETKSTTLFMRRFSIDE